MIRRPPRSTLFPYTTALPICSDHVVDEPVLVGEAGVGELVRELGLEDLLEEVLEPAVVGLEEDRKSTRLNSSHANISYAVFCLKKKKETEIRNMLHLH